MNLDDYNLSLFAESEEAALEKIKEKLKQKDDEMVKLDLNPSLNECYFREEKAMFQFSMADNDFWNSLEFVFSASAEDKNTARRIYETLHSPLEEQAKSFKPDDRGRITLGSEYADQDEVQVIIVES